MIAQLTATFEIARTARWNKQ